MILSVLALAQSVLLAHCSLCTFTSSHPATAAFRHRKLLGTQSFQELARACKHTKLPGTRSFKTHEAFTPQAAGRPAWVQYGQSRNYSDATKPALQVDRKGGEDRIEENLETKLVLWHQNKLYIYLSLWFSHIKITEIYREILKEIFLELSREIFSLVTFTEHQSHVVAQRSQFKQI